MTERSASLLVGVLADTHGRLRPEAIAALAGCDRILHAGDVGAAEILDRLAAVAPVDAVRGNVDEGPWADDLPLARTIRLGGVRTLLHHGHVPPPAADLAAAELVVQGHSHRFAIETRDGRLHLNPGSAGPRRFRLPVTLARLRITGGRAGAERIERIDLP